MIVSRRGGFRSVGGVRSIGGAIAIVLLALSSSGWAEDSIRVAVFKGDGVGPSVNDVLSSIDAAEDDPFEVRRITADEIRAGELSSVDVLIQPGGSGSKQGKTLGKEGRDAVVRFVKEGGGYLGVCGGAYLATNDYTWSLNLIDAKCVDRAHWARGTGPVTVRLSPAAAAMFGTEKNELSIFYGQGPLLGRREWDDVDVPDYQSLAIYESEIAKKGAPKGVMKGTSAVVRTDYEAGRVFCFSAHPEKTEGLGYMIPIAIRWLAKSVDEDAVEVPAISDVVRKHAPATSAGGIAVLVTRGGEVIHRKGYGFAKGQRLTTHSPLSLASVTKQFAAVCAAMLMEEGRLDPAQKVSDLLPNTELPMALKLPKKEQELLVRELLVRDLLWHTSGLANFIESEEKASIAEFKRQRGLDFLNNKTHAEWLGTMELRRPPGQEFEYTNSGYVLLCRIIEVITGEPFHQFQQRRIFDVLGMSGTTDSMRFNGSGNMKTTLVDYTKWDQALWERDSRLLAPVGYDRLFERGALDNGEPIDYGFGWRLRYNGGRLVHAEHGGVGSGTTAARNLIRRHTDDETTVAIFAQENPTLGRSDRSLLVSELYETVLRLDSR